VTDTLRHTILLNVSVKYAKALATLKFLTLKPKKSVTPAMLMTNGKPADLIKMNTLLDIAKRICQEIVVHKDAIKIHSSCYEGLAVISVDSHPADTRKLVGSKGAIAQAVERIVAMIGKANGITATFHVNETERIDSGYTPKPTAKYSAKAHGQLLCDIGQAIYGDDVEVKSKRMDAETTAFVLHHKGLADEQFKKDLLLVFSVMGKAVGHGVVATAKGSRD